MIIFCNQIKMGNLCIIRWKGHKAVQNSQQVDNENKQLQQQDSQNGRQEIFRKEYQRRQKILNQRVAYNPLPIFKPSYQSQKEKFQLQIPSFLQIIKSQGWRLHPNDIEDLIRTNILQHIEASNALSLQLALYKDSAIYCQQILASNIIPRSSAKKKPKKNDLNLIQGQIYASLFRIRFVWLKKLRISGQSQNHPQAIVSLEILQYLDSPFLEQLQADADNLTNIRFLRKCHWKRLTTLTLRNTKIADSSHFASILPCLTNSQHIETINLSSEMDTQWNQISWILKMGYSNAQKEAQRLQIDDQYFQKYDGKYPRRIQFGITKRYRTRSHHIQQLRQKFNNRLVDNPISLW